jgi:ribokinase
VAGGGALWQLPAFPAQVVDTTGAGDAFSAGLIYARLHGLGDPAAGLLANALGSLATQVLGAGLALPGKAEARRLLEAKEKVASAEIRGWMREALEVLQ